jgi:hypothetical protein
MNKTLKSFIEGPLRNHADLIAAGIPPAQAESITISQFVTNEQDQMDLREKDLRSDCCRARVAWAGLNVYCTRCGEYCRTI